MQRVARKAKAGRLIFEEPGPRASERFVSQYLRSLQVFDFGLPRTKRLDFSKDVGP